MLAIINIYQIITSLISIIFFFQDFINSFGRIRNYFKSFTSFLIIILLAYILFTNVYALFNKKKISSYLTINIWFNFIQIFYISILGINYYLLIGLQIIPYYSYLEASSFKIYFEFFSVRMGIFYKPNNEIAIAINLIPLIIFIILNNYKKKFFDVLHRLPQGTMQK